MDGGAENEIGAILKSVEVRVEVEVWVEIGNITTEKEVRFKKQVFQLGVTLKKQYI